MANRPDAFMPLWIGDYLADTTHLTSEQHGPYLLLLMAYWRRGGPLPADDRALSAQAKVTMYKWRALRPTLAAFFQEVDGLWVHKRCDIELAKAESRYNNLAAAGRKGAENRKINASKATYVLPNNIRAGNGSALEATSSTSPTVSKGSATTKTAEISQLNDGVASTSPISTDKQSHLVSKKVIATKSASLEAKPETHAPAVKAADVVPLHPQGQKSKREQIFDNLAKALGWPPENLYRLRSFENFGSVYADWIEKGCDPDKDIWPTIAKLSGRAKNISRPITSPNYFEDAIFTARDNRMASLPTPSEMREKLRGAVGAFKLQGWWHDDFGPKPFEPGCTVPAEIIREIFPENSAAMH